MGTILVVLSIILIIFFGRIVIKNRKKVGPVNLTIPKVPEGQTTRNPGIAAVLSFILPGLGQIYNGQFENAWKDMIVYFFGLLCVILSFSVSEGGMLLIAIGLFFLVAVWISSIRKAYRSALAINEILDGRGKEKSKKCPFCSEIIKAEAVICRFCGKEQAIQKSGVDILNRIACSDIRCFGLVGPDGRCEKCGKTYETREQAIQNSKHTSSDH